MQRQVLLLNASEEILNVIDWKKAICLLLSGKAIKPVYYKENYKINTTTGKFYLPKAIMLTSYVPVPYHHTLPSRKNIFIRDRWACQYCGFKSKKPSKLTIDHVTPKSRGGDSSWTNLVTACPGCNMKKSNKKPNECKMPLLQKPRKPQWLELHFNSIETQLKDSWGRWIRISA